MYAYTFYPLHECIVHLSHIFHPFNACMHMCASVLADVTSCALRNGGCDHICSLGAEGRIHCSCRAGWELSADQRTCIGKTYKKTIGCLIYFSIPHTGNSFIYMIHMNCLNLRKFVLCDCISTDYQQKRSFNLIK